MDDLFFLYIYKQTKITAHGTDHSIFYAGRKPEFI